MLLFVVFVAFAPQRILSKKKKKKIRFEREGVGGMVRLTALTPDGLVAQAKCCQDKETASSPSAFNVD